MLTERITKHDSGNWQHNACLLNVLSQCNDAIYTHVTCADIVLQVAHRMSLYNQASLVILR